MTTYQIFISYNGEGNELAGESNDLIENFKAHLYAYGINAWVYSIDKILAKNTWKEIENRINSSRLMIFAVSASTSNSEGQQRELEMAIEKVKQIGFEYKILPLVLYDSSFSLLPKQLRSINGERLHGGNVKTTAMKIAKQFFPELFRENLKANWRFPFPGQWLRVSNLDEMIEQYFDIDDELYFRRISPLGLFECYSPKSGDIFWIAPDNVEDSVPIDDEDDENDRQRIVPFRYQISGMIEIEQIGIEKFERQKRNASEQGQTSNIEYIW